MNSEEIKKMLGNPKITFILGGPASGKGTQCAKLVEEFGYRHLSAGDLLRIEMDKGTREGEKIKKLMAQGALVPQEVTVQLLVNAMIANPSKNYLIDGFPRSTEQAVYFEQNVMECQTVLFYEVSEAMLIQRCLGRAQTSGRIDDNEETLKKRFNTYNEQTRPVIDLYRKFGKVRTIDGNRGINEVYADTKKALLPEVYFLIGPKASGKTIVGKHLAEKTNMQLLNFKSFCHSKGIQNQDDEAKVFKLIGYLNDSVSPRILLEDFP